jgi:hypothetical protein
LGALCAIAPSGMKRWNRGTAWVILTSCALW